MFTGAVQETSRLVVEPEVADTLGAAGAAGGSFTSVTMMVTVVVAVPPWFVVKGSLA